MVNNNKAKLIQNAHLGNAERSKKYPNKPNTADNLSMAKGNKSEKDDDHRPKTLKRVDKKNKTTF